ncbi:MAG: C10 family peptidase [Lentimicrobium sp.]|nr:C10 family peptidase [Lentimicrobium sp.]
MNKKYLLFLIVCGLFLNVTGRTIHQREAESVAKAFMHSRLNISQTVAFSEIQIKDIVPLGTEQDRIYAVNMSPAGFVLVAGTDASVPVLGYSFESSFTTENMPVNLNEWLEGYKLQLKDLTTGNIQATADISMKWADLLQYNPELALNMRGTTEVQPLLNSTWDQGARYNALCPEAEGGPGGRVYAGCVATAMSQVINYWRYPLQGTGSHGYYSDYGYLSVNFGESNYDYNQMNNNIGGESNYEMAEIQYHCGVAVDMMYAPDGSGAYSADVPDAMRDYFGYSSQISIKSKGDYSDAQWAALLMTNLDNGWPLYYSGHGTGGHAFNLDGYQGTDYFHFNWGWSGSYNGYFYLNNLNPGGNNFSESQNAIVNFTPGNNYPYYCTGVTTLTRHNGTIEDGSGPVAPYTSGLNCGWLIAPDDSVKNLTLVFDKFDVTSGIDALNVYDGPDAGSPLLGTYTGSALPPAITASGDKMYVEFLTSGNTGSGWRARYTSDIVSYCSGLTTFTAPEGTFSDGSSDRSYHNNSVCKFKIQPEGASSILLTFNSLNTEPENDVIRVFDYVSQTLIGTYSGNQIPDEILVPSAKAYVLFYTNDEVQGEGWEISYTSTTTGIGETEAGVNGKLKVRCYPNPAKDWLRVEIGSDKNVEVEMHLMSTDGRVVITPEVKSVMGSGVVFIDISSLSNGMYFLKYSSSEGSGISKILVNR